MKTISILLKKKSIEITHISPKSYEYIYDYVDYLLYPYKRLGYFKFISFIESNKIIDGKYSHDKFLSILKDNIQLNKQFSLDIYFGRNNIFLNGESLKFYITPEDYYNIKETINEYFICCLYLYS